MAEKISDMPDRIKAFPGDQSEIEWLNAFEYLRDTLSRSLSSHVHLGCYYIDDIPTAKSAGGCSRVRASSPLPGIESDSWEAVLCWSGNRGSRGHAGAYIFPFLDGSPVQPDGRIADLGPGAEVEAGRYYDFQNGVFVDAGWQWGEGPGEWARVTGPGTVYFSEVEVTLPSSPVRAGSPIYAGLSIKDLVEYWANPNPNSRITLIHANRNREGSNLSPWTARPATKMQHALDPKEILFRSPQELRIRLDAFNIRGGWVPGKYHLSLRLQNFHQPNHWAWSSQISEPFKLTVV